MSKEELTTVISEGGWTSPFYSLLLDILTITTYNEEAWVYKLL
jgi:hypothetical protein